MFGSGDGALNRLAKRLNKESNMEERVIQQVDSRCCDRVMV